MDREQIDVTGKGHQLGIFMDHHEVKKLSGIGTVLSERF
jgi:hypothetical protein